MNIALLHFKKVIRFMLTRGPRYASFMVTNQCNRNCPYCSVPKDQNLELPVQIWNAITDKVTKWGVRWISILGGEPMLRKDLVEIIRHASKKAAVSLISNGDAFRGSYGQERLHFLASAGLSNLIFSLHQLEDLEWQLEILKLAKKLGVIPLLAVVATKTSIEYLPEVMKETNKQGIFFRYALCQTVGGSFSPTDVALRPTSEQISTFINIVRQQKKQSRFVMNTEKYLERANLYPNVWHCNNHKDCWIVVNSQGHLMACNEWPTTISALNISSLDDPNWVKTRATIQKECPGCTHHCYIEQEETKGLSLVKEIIEKAIGLL